MSGTLRYPALVKVFSSSSRRGVRYGNPSPYIPLGVWTESLRLSLPLQCIQATGPTPAKQSACDLRWKAEIGIGQGFLEHLRPAGGDLQALVAEKQKQLQYGVSYPRGCFRPSVFSAYDTWV